MKTGVHDFARGIRFYPLMMYSLATACAACVTSGEAPADEQVASTSAELSLSTSATTISRVNASELTAVQPVTSVALAAATRINPSSIKLPLVCPPPDGTRPDPTLVNTDSFVLSRFPMQRVVDQLVNLAGVSGPSSLSLYQQMWDSLDTSAQAKFAGPHCDDNGSTINKFPIDCPRPEAKLKNSTPAAFSPVALFNRFDLSASNGAHCGEYRIVYALSPNATIQIDPPIVIDPLPSELLRPVKSTTLANASLASSQLTKLRIGTTRVNGRNFVIFEAVLPNPNPSCGVEACRPVVDFWEKLASQDPTTAAGQQALADGLEQFYFKGLPGFEPVVHPAHYGQGGTGGYGPRSFGQVRTNMFVDQRLWQLREFHLMTHCETGSCQLQFDPVTVKNNPFHTMWNPLEASPDPRAPAFQATLPAQTSALANDALAQIGMSIDNVFNAGQSTSQAFNEDYAFQFSQGSPPNAFSAAIDAQLGAISRTDLSATDIARRATTQSCAGCHQLSNNAALGGTHNPVWPSSRGFVHVDESSNLSPALWCVFLPARKSVLDGFFSSPPHACPPPTNKLPTPVVVLDPRLPLPPPPPLAEASAITISGKIAGPN